MTGKIELRYRFAPEVRTPARDGNRLTLDVEGWKALGFTAATPAHADAVEALAGAGATFDRLAEIATGAGSLADGQKAAAYFVERFSRARLLHWDLADETGVLASVVPLAAGYQPRTDPPPGQPLALCRFAFLRRTPEGMMLESGATRAQMRVAPRGLAALSQALAAPDVMVPDVGTPDMLAGLLWRLGFFDVAAPQEDDSRSCWEFHDLLMHETSRFNRDLPGGATYRFEGQIPAPPAAKPTMPGERVELPSIDAAALRTSSGSIDALQERRRSIRAYADRPITLAALAEFLWRVARTTVPPFGTGSQELMGRPYPAGGAINELEFYVAVRRCEGLDSAFYHYDSHGHALVRIANSQKIAAAIVAKSASAMALQPDQPQPDVTIVVSSRLPRLAWKYERMAYRASLLHAGVAIELMYLVATDMKLACCANGSGDSRLFETATGLDRFEETAIAEFCLGVPVES
jgi:SagB-type dehydrogenase family enzyme